jgi:vancomycin resistance protein YoaR
MVSSRPTRSYRSTGTARSAVSKRRRRRLPRGPARSSGPAWFRALAAGHSRILRILLWALVGLAFLVALSTLVDGAVYAKKIHAGVTIGGLDMSGLTREEAAAALTKHVNEAQGRSATLVGEKKTWKVSPASAGVEIDIGGTVSAAIAVTRDANIVVDLASKFKLYFSGHDVPLRANVDQAKLDAVIDPLAKEIDVPAVNAGVDIQGSTVKEIRPQDGLTVDRELLGEQLVLALCRLESTEVPIPLVVDKPEVQVEDNAAVLARTKTMLGGPLTLTSVGDSWTFSTREVAGFVDFKSEVVDGVTTSVPYISAEKLAPTFQRLSKLMSPTPIDAHFEGDDEKAWVVPAVPGRVLKPEETAEALNAAALKTTGRTAEAVVDLTEPEFSTQEAEAMGIKDLLSVRTTEFVGTKNRQNNVRVATAAISKEGKSYLAPGEEFSFAKTVGPRSPEQGYKIALGIQPNGDLDGELGGGICQVATTLFNSVFFAGLKVTQRRNHTIYITHYPQGRDAAVTTDEVDLKFVNDTDHYIWIKGESSGIKTTFWIYGTDDGRKVTFRNSGIMNQGRPPNVWTSVDPSLPPGKTVVISAGQPYRKIIVTRWTTWPDGTVKEDVFTSIYPLRAKIVHVAPT